MNMVTDEFVRPDIGAIKQNPFMPKPKGHKILVMVLPAANKTAGGIILTDAHTDREQAGTMVGYVCAFGPEAYTDHTRFPGGPRCDEGDFVVFRAYSGTRLDVDGYEMRLLNDDTVEAVVEDPRAIKRK